MKLGCLGLLLVALGGLFLLFGIVGGALGIGFGIAGTVIHGVFSALGGFFRAIFH